MTLAVEAEGVEITTVEGVASPTAMAVRSAWRELDVGGYRARATTYFLAEIEARRAAIEAGGADGALRIEQLRELRDRLEAEVGHPLPELSMGMSHDFEVAIAEGATMVRVGTAIFGHRG